jgi:VWFA-related protein
MKIPRFRPSGLKALVIRTPSARWACGLGMMVLLALPPPVGPQAAPDQGVIQTETHVVLVNVVVKDKHGKPVDDLRRDDFQLLDNNQEQKIALFALEAGSETATARSPGRMTFTNRPGPSGAAVTVFLFDELNTGLPDQELAKKDFLHYLRGLPSDSRVAVFVLGDSLVLLHDFFQDMASLVAAIEKHSSRINPEVAAATAAPASSNSLTGDPTTTAQWDSFIKASNQPYIDYSETVRATSTAAALETIAGHLQGISGRKTLIWISGGFPIQLGLHSDGDTLPQSNPGARRPSASPVRSARGTGAGAGGNGGGKSGGGNPSSSSTSTASTPQLPYSGQSFDSDVQRAIRALDEADVAVYPVDARGVMVSPAFQADRSSIGKRSKPPRAGSPTDFNYETLDTLAQETGGQAFHHINDLSSAIQEAASDARVSYSLAFYPPADSLDGSYHRLEVTVKRPGVKLRYRPGYVAVRHAAVDPPLDEAIKNPVALAGIGLAVHLDPVEGGYKATVTIDPHNITLESRDGKWSGSLQFLVVVGKVEQLTTIPLNLSEAMFHQIQDKGLVLGARVKAPQGTTGFSLGFRDIPSGMVGTLHVIL